MAGSDYLHGVRVIELNDGTRPIRTISTAVIGLVCTAEDADPLMFPLDTPVPLTNVQSAIAKAGVKGPLASSLQAIADRSLVDVQVVRSNPSEQTDAPLRFDETTGALLKPAAAPARVLGLLATQVLKNSATPSNTRFGLRRRMDCWWVHL